MTANVVADTIQESPPATGATFGGPRPCDVLCAPPDPASRQTVANHLSRQDRPASTPDHAEETYAAMLDRWRRRNPFYHQRKIEYLQFVVPPGESVLVLGCEDGALIDALRPSRGVGVDVSPSAAALGRKRYPKYEFVTSADYDIDTDERFAYVILNDMAGYVDDLFALLTALRRHTSLTSRLVIVQHNYLWRPVLRCAAALRLKRPERIRNWLSVGDLRVFLEATGFEPIDVRPKLFCPKRWLGVGPAINWVAGLMPFVGRLASTEILVARPGDRTTDAARKTASIVLTTRDEHANIEPMVQSIPEVGAHTEILFVEGHSTDGTREEIERVICAYPERNIRLLVQDGIGQGDAIRKGFDQATGDVIILLEADRTSPPEDVLKVFEVVASGRAEYVNGSRFVYPRQPGSMPVLNVIGNALFAVWFTWFLGQRTSDVLCGIKAIDRVQFRRLLRNWGFLGLHDPFGDFELAFGAARLGLKISEVPTRYACRQYGVPKTRPLRHGWMLLRMVLRATRVFKCR